MNDNDIKRALVRISHQITEKNHGTDNLCIIGIKSRGVPLAHRIAANIKAFEGVDIPVGELDITHYRDDLEQAPDPLVGCVSEVGFSVVGKTVILVDDVIFTGRTVRAALDAIVELGRPARIQLAVLVDRGHTELPIKANYIGKNIPSSLSEVIRVRLEEHDEVQTSVTIWEK